MPKGLVRYQKCGVFHFLTFSCYRRQPLLAEAGAGCPILESLSDSRVGGHEPPLTLPASARTRTDVRAARYKLLLQCQRVLFDTRSAASFTFSPSVVIEGSRCWPRPELTRSSSARLKACACDTALSLQAMF